jgi:hypothetical protein
MCWISLAATRYDTRAEAEVQLDDWEDSTENSSSMKPVLLAFLSGEQQYVARARKLSHKLLQFFDDSEDLLHPAVLPDVVGLSVAAHIDGDDQTRLWKKIVTRAKPKDARMRALQAVVSKLLSAPGKSEPRPEPVRGHVHTEAQWIKLVAKGPAHRIFDLAATPDHPLWLDCLQFFVLPLGLIYHRELTAADVKDVSIFDLFRMGSYPWRHPAVIYERVQEKPDSLSRPDPKDPATWFGIDAIDVLGDNIRAYHYLGFDWQAPLLFEGGVNAYRFLDTLDLSWKQVEQTIPKPDWQMLSPRLNSEKCSHIVVHDEEVSPAVSPDIEDAAKHYGLRLDVEDVTTA